MHFFRVLICATLLPTLLWADILRPDTLDDTLALQLEALRADPRILSPAIDATDKSIKFTTGGSDAPYTVYPDNLHKLLQGAEDDAARQVVFDDFIQYSNLKDLGLDMDAAFALAQTNQAARQWNPKIEGDGIYFLQLDGTFEASLLLDNALWDFVEGEIGPVLLTASNRDVVLFGPSDNPEVRRILTQLAQKYVAEGSYALSAQLMVRRDGGWVVSQ